MRKLFFALSALLALFSAKSEAAPNVSFLSPGIIANRGGTWVGTDHLYNLDPNIGVVVEILKPEGEEFPVSADELQMEIEGILQKAGISTDSGELSPLPYYHLLVMVQTEKEEHVVYLSARLFEAVKVARVYLEPETLLQGITWEKQTLIVSPKAVAKDTIVSNVRSMTDGFVERFQYYEDLKKQISQ